MADNIRGLFDSQTPDEMQARGVHPRVIADLLGPQVREETSEQFAARKQAEEAARPPERLLNCMSAFCRVATFNAGRVGNTCPGCDKAGS